GMVLDEDLAVPHGRCAHRGHRSWLRARPELARDSSSRLPIGPLSFPYSGYFTCLETVTTGVAWILREDDCTVTFRASSALAGGKARSRARRAPPQPRRPRRGHTRRGRPAGDADPGVPRGRRLARGDDPLASANGPPHPQGRDAIERELLGGRGRAARGAARGDG